MKNYHRKQFPAYAQIAAFAVVMTVFTSSERVSAADFTWVGGGAGGLYTDGTNWVGGTAPAISGTDDIVTPAPQTPGTTPSVFVNTSATVRNFTITLGSPTGSWAMTNPTGTSVSYTISGTLTKGGGNTFSVLNNTGVASGFALTIGTVNMNAGTLSFGSSRMLSSLTVNNLATVSGGSVNVFSGSAAFNGGIEIDGASTQLRVFNTAAAGTGGMSAAFLSGGGGGVVASASAASTATLTLNGSSGSFSFSGTISNGSVVGSTLAIAKNGAYIQGLSGANTYSGGTEVNAGTLLVGSSSALGVGNVDVSGGTVDLNASSVLNLSMGSGSRFALNSGQLNMNLNTTTNYDSITLNGGVLGINGGTLALSLTGGAGGFTGYAGTYQLFQGFSGITGANDGTKFTGISITGYDTSDYTASLGINGALTFAAVPEPHIVGMFVAGLMLIAFVRGRSNTASSAA